LRRVPLLGSVDACPTLRLWLAVPAEVVSGRICISPGAAAGAKGPLTPNPRKRLRLSSPLPPQPGAAASASRAYGAWHAPRPTSYLLGGNHPRYAENLLLSRGVTIGAGWSFSSLRGSPEGAWNPEKAARPIAGLSPQAQPAFKHCPHSGSDSKSASHSLTSSQASSTPSAEAA
jgi:hypothetical protein